MHNTQVHLRLTPRQVRPFSMDGAAENGLTLDDLALLGVQFPAKTLDALRAAYPGFSMDSAGPAMVTLASAGAPVQFLQTLLPGTIRTVTAARKIDAIIGRTIAGNWHDEDIVQTIVELLGQARPYGDSSPGPMSRFNLEFERRSVVRFEMDMEVAVLEEERAAAVRQNSGELKRAAISQALAVEHNAVGFFGYNDGECRTYGFLNDPNLPYYQSVPVGASGATQWQDKNFWEIAEDVRVAAAALRIQSKEAVDPDKDRCVLVLSTAARECLTVITEHGVSVLDWIKTNFPGWTIESAPELDGANGGQNVFYIFAVEVAGAGETGAQKVVEQYVQAVLRLLGVEKRAKGVYEVYSSATAGVMWQAPYAVVRFSGI
jgi:hypothetical protein